MTQDADERRSWERRIEVLEKNYERLQNSVQRVEIEQVHVKEMMKSNFNALDTGQKHLITKIDQFMGLLNSAGGEIDGSPAGRALMREIKDLQERNTEREKQMGTLTRELTDLRSAKDRVVGAMLLGGGGGATGVVALLKAFGVF